MRQAKFLPEVARNRLITNWVLASFGPKQAASVVRKRSSSNRLKPFVLPLLSVTVVLSVALGYFGLPNRSSSLERVIDRPPSIGVSSHDSRDMPSTTSCTADDLQASLDGYAPSRDGNELVSGYKALPGQDFGGALVIDFVCEDSRTNDAFRSMWFLVNKKWRLNEISRPPSRQPGDF